MNIEKKLIDLKTAITDEDEIRATLIKDEIVTEFDRLQYENETQKNTNVEFETYRKCVRGEI